MSREELVSSYRAGHISRRRFIKGMTALGVSFAAANAYAIAVAAPAKSANHDDEYPPSGDPPGTDPPGRGHGRGPGNPSGDPPGSNPPGGGKGRGGGKNP